MNMNEANPSNADTEDLGSIAALVVDDDRKSANLVRTILEPFGVSVVSVRTAEEAGLMLAAIEPEVILCEIVLPGEDGLTFMRRLRGGARRESRDIPAIAMTAAYETFDARAAHEAGFDVFLKKPIDPERLPQLVALLVAKGRRPPSARHESRAP